MPVCKKGVVRRKSKTPNEAINIVRSTNKTSTSTLINKFYPLEQKFRWLNKKFHAGSMPVFTYIAAGYVLNLA